MLKVSEVTKKYGQVRALDGISLELEKGEVVALLGANGSGKSTLLSIMALSLKPDSGMVDVDGLSPEKAKKMLAFVPQTVTLFEELTVCENLYAWSSLRGDEMKKKAGELIDTLGMETFKKRRVEKLSGGQRRRVNLAISLMSSAQYILLDEPLAGVDSEGVSRIMQLISNEKKSGKGIIISEHNAEAVSEIADRTIYLECERLDN